MSELNIIQFPFLFQLIETEYGSKYARKKSRSVNYSYANQNPIYTPISRYQFLSLTRSQHAQLWWFSLSVRLIFDLNYFTLDQLVQYQLAHDHTFSLCIARIQRHPIELKLADRKEFHSVHATDLRFCKSGALDLFEADFFIDLTMVILSISREIIPFSNWIHERHTMFPVFHSESSSSAVRSYERVPLSSQIVSLLIN